VRAVLYYHSLVSDWNHGNAHFLRGVVAELMACGHRVDVYEPAGGWSLANLLAEQGQQVVDAFAQAFPALSSRFYRADSLDLDEVLGDADVVVVHEWNEPELVARVGAWRSRHRRLRALFHDTHHRSVSDPAAVARLDLAGYDGVLAYGRAVRDQYLHHQWARQVWIWHEAADTRVFFPRTPREPLRDLVWIGNWGDDERTTELTEFLIEPVAALSLDAEIYGVRYPPDAIERLAQAGARYGGWLANHRVPETFARFKATVHVPRRAYVAHLPGVPTIRPFEALACGIPLVSAPWPDDEGLFTPGEDFLVARNGREMQERLRDVLRDASLSAALVRHGLATIRARHTCVHRVVELLAILQEIGCETRAGRPPRERLGHVRNGEGHAGLAALDACAP
jgi:spore maturation protein CgeB